MCIVEAKRVIRAAEFASGDPARLKFAEQFGIIRRLASKIQADVTVDKEEAQRAIIWLQSAEEVCYNIADSLDDSIFWALFQLARTTAIERDMVEAAAGRDPAEVAPTSEMRICYLAARARDQALATAAVFAEVSAAATGAFGVDISTLKMERSGRTPLGFAYCAHGHKVMNTECQVDKASFDIFELYSSRGCTKSEVEHNSQIMRQIWTLRHPNIAGVVGGRFTTDDDDCKGTRYPYLLFQPSAGARILADVVTFTPANYRFRLLEEIVAGLAYACARDARIFPPNTERLSPFVIRVDGAGSVKLSPNTNALHVPTTARVELYSNTYPSGHHCIIISSQALEMCGAEHPIHSIAYTVGLLMYYLMSGDEWGCFIASHTDIQVSNVPLPLLRDQAGRDPFFDQVSGPLDQLIRECRSSNAAEHPTLAGICARLRAIKNA